jgi:hypothetical protein
MHHLHHGGMRRVHIVILAVGLGLAAAATVVFYFVSVRQMDQAMQPNELEVIRRLLQASRSKLVTLELNKVKRAAARTRATRICAQAVELWGGYAHRCAGEGDREQLREAVRQAARETLGCDNIRRIGSGDAIDRCFDFLMTGPCDVLRSSPEELGLSLGEAMAGASDKPQPHAVCLGVF